MRLPDRHLALLASAGILLTAAACSAPQQGRRFGSIGTAGTGGIYYPLGGALARLLSQRLPEIQFTAEVTGGSVENLNRVAAGQIDIGMAIGTTLAKALEGTEAARYGDLRIIAPLYPNVAHLLVAPGAGIASLGDLSGRTVSIGAAGSGTEQMSRDLLSVYGLTVGDIKARYLSFAESSAALRDRAIDAAILSVGYPASAVLEATTAAGVQLIGIEQDRLSRLVQRFPYYRPSILPAGAYPSVDEDLPTVAVMNWLFANSDLDARIVVALLEVLEQDREQLRGVNEIASQIDLAQLTQAPMALHAASAAWMRDRQPLDQSPRS